MSKFTNTLTENEKLEILTKVANCLLNFATLDEVLLVLKTKFPKEDYDKMHEYTKVAYDCYHSLNLTDEEKRIFVEVFNRNARKQLVQ